MRDWATLELIALRESMFSGLKKVGKKAYLQSKLVRL